MKDRRTIARSTGLAALAFVATLILLVGLAIGVAGRLPGSAGQAPTLDLGAGGSVSGESPPLTPVPGGGDASPEASLPVPSSPEGDPVLVGAGDIASCNLDGDEATARLIDAIGGSVFTAGDNAYENGSDGDFANCYAPTWGRFKDRTRPAPGNHDYQTRGAAGYKAYFGPAAVNADGDTWYSYDLGTWHIIVLDSNCSSVGGCDAGSKQGEWLVTDLAASTAGCTLAIWHHPRFSSGDEHGNDPQVDPFWRQLYAAGADVVINGHDHDYERFAPQDPDGVEDRKRGIREFVVGTGGAEIRGFSRPVANSELRLAVAAGVIKLTLHDGSYDWSWSPTSADVTDSGSGPCH